MITKVLLHVMVWFSLATASQLCLTRLDCNVTHGEVCLNVQFAQQGVCTPCSWLNITECDSNVPCIVKERHTPGIRDDRFCELDVISASSRSDMVFPFWILQIMSFSNGIFTLVTFSKKKHDKEPSPMSILLRAYGVAMLLAGAHNDWIKLKLGLSMEDNLVMSVVAAVLASSGNMPKAVAAWAMFTYGHQDDLHGSSVRSMLFVRLRSIFLSLTVCIYFPAVLVTTPCIILGLFVFPWVAVIGAFFAFAIAALIARPVEALKQWIHGSGTEMSSPALLDCAQPHTMTKKKKRRVVAGWCLQRLGYTGKCVLCCPGSIAEAEDQEGETRMILFFTSMTPIVCFLLIVFVRWANPNNDGYLESLRITIMERRFVTQANLIYGKELKIWNLMWLVI